MGDMPRPSRWQRYVDAAVSSPQPGHPERSAAPGRLAGPAPESRRRTQQVRTVAPGGLPAFTRRLRDHARARLAPERAAPARVGEARRRTDLRLVPPVLLVWATAVAGNWLGPAGLAALCSSLAAVSGVLLQVVARGKARRGFNPGRPAPRSLLTTLAVAMLLSAAAGAHTVVAAFQRHDGAVAEAVAARAAVVAELEIAGAPRRLRIPGSSGLADRFAVPATLHVMYSDSRRVNAEAGLLIMGGSDWEQAVPGQHLRVTGKLRPPEPGQADAGILSASSVPVLLRAPDAWHEGPGELRRSFTAAAAELGGDVQGLLPGMVTGDTSALDAQLDSAMKTVGMTHLTAVSGANCSLILGTLLLAARTLRLPRAAAAGVCLTGLGMFVLMVGPDPSVLRAALMGAVGLASVAFGRAGRGLSFLCVAVIGLLLAEPVLATSFGFLLSVLATLGIVVTGRRIMDWLPPAVPRWAAAGLAVPLSAQTFCGPVIVLLQPQFAAYALPANVAAAGLVAPVTLLGTAAVPLVSVVPAAADALMGVAAVFAAGVAGIARFFASLPGAALPWPEGVFGLSTMGLFSGVALAIVWLVLHPAAAMRLALAAHSRAVAFLDRQTRRGAWLAARWAGQRAGRRGLVDRSGRGTLRVCKPTSGRNQEWQLPRPNAPGLRRRRPPPGVTSHRPRWSWWAGRRTIWAAVPWTGSVRRFARPRPMSKSPGSTPAATRRVRWP
ncbi:ComEC/Rec2 family competence protein [Pseudarthrobacter sp. S9]|uniref:ComEC/Rec2 family competence protein n=1 Tax=Pseudarthrobacter sp. S9 TaxID=3418421 RepID=UPI003CFF7F3C